MLRFTLLSFTFLTFAAYAGECPQNEILKQKKIRNAYTILRKHTVQCKKQSKLFLEFGKRAFLAERLAESLWAAEIGQQSASNESLLEELNLLEASALIEMNRYEEAIIILKPSVLSNDSSLVYRQKGHLILIKAYFKKFKSKKNPNVLYLVHLFLNRYTQSNYIDFLNQWLEV